MVPNSFTPDSLHSPLFPQIYHTHFPPRPSLTSILPPTHPPTHQHKREADVFNEKHVRDGPRAWTSTACEAFSGARLSWPRSRMDVPVGVSALRSYTFSVTKTCAWRGVSCDEQVIMAVTNNVIVTTD